MNESRRGCGWRQVGGLYLMGQGLAVPCDRLPWNVEVCPVCGQGIKFSRGFTWITRDIFIEDCEHLGDTSIPCHTGDCPLCHVFVEDPKVGLMWVGEKYYTPQSFIFEAKKMGVSKRIAHFPKDLEFGKTWVLLAHPKAGSQQLLSELPLLMVDTNSRCPAIFYAFKPTAVETLVKKSEATEDKLASLRKRGITPVVVEDNWPPIAERG